ncbi:velvet factor [Trichophaea hybrida]|nr:velvet factor [Trichophaea hybrida]
MAHPTQQHHHGVPPPPLPMARGSPSSSSSQQPPPPPVASNGMVQNYPPPPQNVSCRGDGRIYTLEVKQQPIRARMCGFGDKDRRPITPPPCVRLVVKDEATGKEVDINEVDTSHYVLTVDLWSADGTREVNLVRHSATSPSISAATSSSYPPPPPTPPPHPHPQAHHTHHVQQQHPGYSQHAPQMPPQNTYQGYSSAPSHPQQQPPQQQQGYYQQPQQHQNGPAGYYPSLHPQAPVPPQQQQQQQQLQAQQTPSGMFTRNLIGSLSASAFKLTDPDNKIGVWFILQDLSVRTEGSFRLKMNFVNVGRGDGKLNTGVTPVLATAYSDVFQVYSAKKFPGVIESTGLSKCFATQGIKIPIRRDKGDGPEL